VHCWTSQNIKDIKLWECVQRRALDEDHKERSYSTKIAGVQEAFGHHSQIEGLSIPVCSQELDSVISMGSSHLRMSCRYMIHSQGVGCWCQPGKLL